MATARNIVTFDHNGVSLTFNPNGPRCRRDRRAKAKMALAVPTRQLEPFCPLECRTHSPTRMTKAEETKNVPGQSAAATCQQLARTIRRQRQLCFPSAQ